MKTLRIWFGAAAAALFWCAAAQAAEPGTGGLDPRSLFRKEHFFAARVDFAKFAELPLYKARPDLFDRLYEKVGCNPLRAKVATMWAFLGMPPKGTQPCPTLLFAFARPEDSSAFLRDSLPGELDSRKAAAGGIEYRAFEGLDEDVMAYCVFGGEAVLVGREEHVRDALLGRSGGNPTLSALLDQTARAGQAALVMSVAGLADQGLPLPPPAQALAGQVETISFSLDCFGPRLFDARLKAKAGEAADVATTINVFQRMAAAPAPKGVGLSEADLAWNRLEKDVLKGAKAMVEGNEVRFSAPRPPSFDELAAVVAKAIPDPAAPPY